MNWFTRLRHQSIFRGPENTWAVFKGEEGFAQAPNGLSDRCPNRRMVGDVHIIQAGGGNSRPDTTISRLLE